MKEVLKLEKFKVNDIGDIFVVQAHVVDKGAIREYINKYGDKFYYKGLGLNLSDILNDKDTTKIVNEETYKRISIVCEAFNEMFSDEIKPLDEFKKLTTDEKLNTIYSLLLECIQEY